MSIYTGNPEAIVYLGVKLRKKSTKKYKKDINVLEKKAIASGKITRVMPGRWGGWVLYTGNR